LSAAGAQAPRLDITANTLNSIFVDCIRLLISTILDQHRSYYRLSGSARAQPRPRIRTIDNALPPRLADLLVVVSADSDFRAILAAQEADRPSFILFREMNLLVARDYLPVPRLPFSA
jgi:hypothetical protein